MYRGSYRGASGGCPGGKCPIRLRTPRRFALYRSISIWIAAIDRGAGTRFGPWALPPTMPSADLSDAIASLAPAQSGCPDTPEISRGKIDCLSPPARRITTLILDGYGLRNQLLARPIGSCPSGPRLCSTLPSDRATPLRFANPSSP
jgi:hypothetical protein